MKKLAVAIGLALLAAAAPVAGMPASAAGDPQASRVTDACDVPADPAKDLAQVAFGYNAEAFQVGVDLCQRLTEPNGDWLITFHLTSFSPEVQITGVLQDVGRYESWSGFRLCASSSCPVSAGELGTSQPSGSALDDIGFGYVPFDDNCWNGDPACVPAAEQPPTSPFAYGAWTRHLPGVAIPDNISWWAEVRQRTAPDTFGTRLDRAPEVGTATSPRLPAGRPTTVAVSPGPVPTWNAGVAGAQRTDSGTLRTDDAPVPNRLVTILGARGHGHRDRTRSDGRWTTTYQVGGNTVARATFPGDGVHAGSTSAPYHAYVRAFVSLDLSSRLRIGTPVDLRGVVRPRGSGGVEVLVKPDRPGYAWSLLRTASLVAGRTDTYYRVPWTPRSPGRYVLVTRWRHGTTAQGGVLNGQSAYRYVTVG